MQAELRPEGSDIVWKFPLSEIVEELIRAANQVRMELARVDVGTDVQVGMETHVRLIRSVLPKNNPD